MAERWLTAGGVNTLCDLDVLWLNRYVTECADHAAAGQIVQEFYRWALQRQLISVVSK